MKDSESDFPTWKLDRSKTPTGQRPARSAEDRKMKTMTSEREKGKNGQQEKVSIPDGRNR